MVINGVEEAPITVYSYQAMEGPALRNEEIPFNVPLWCCKDVFPGFITKHCAVKWSALIDVIDVEDRHYFKEITLDLYYGD